MNSLVLKKWLQKPLVLALLLNATALLISLLLSNGKFSSLDDHFMAMALTGAYGGGFDPHMYFVNSAYAYLLWPLYKLFPAIGWYTIFQMVSIFAAFTSICFVVLKKCGIKLGTLISTMLITCVSTDFYLHVAFTQCAGALTAAGILLMAFADQGSKGTDDSDYSTNCRIRYLQLGLGVLLAVGGFIMRKEMFLLGMPTLCVVLFINFVKNRSIYKPTIVALLALVVCVAGLKAFDKAQFATEGYDYYAAYQPVRAVFGDGAYFDRESLADEMDEWGGGGSVDYRYLKSWFFYDKDVYSVDSLNEKIKYVERNRFVPNYAKMPIAVFRELSNNVLSGHFWCWVALCVALVFLKRGKSGLVPWLSLGVMCVSYAYLLLVNRVVDHVEVGIWIYAIITLLVVADNKLLNSGKVEYRASIGFLVIVCFGVIFVIAAALASADKKGPADAYNNVPNWDEFMEYAAAHNDDVFLLPFDRYKELPSIKSNVFKTPKPDSWNNIVSLGYWNILFPPIEKELAKRGVTNPMKDILNDNVYVLEEVTQMSMAPFYWRHYHKRIVKDTIKTFGDMNLLKYRLKTEEAQNENP